MKIKILLILLSSHCYIFCQNNSNQISRSFLQNPRVDLIFPTIDKIEKSIYNIEIRFYKIDATGPKHELICITKKNNN
jgi:hypothetical protein